MPSYDFDLFVIGAGSGGVRAARMAASYGARVGICESHRVGGTCVIRGCIPKKLFVYASHYADEFAAAPSFGWDAPQSRFNWSTLLANKDREIDRLNGLYKQTLASHGVTLVEKRGVLVDAHTIDLEGEQVSAEKILIATGAWPSLPDVPGIEHVITSNEAFELPQWPRSIIIVGGGYIAVEFAGICNGFGTQVTQLYRRDQIMRGFDRDIRDTLASEMRKKGIDLRVNADIAGIEKTAQGLRATLKDGTVLEAEQILYATGRVPATQNMGLETVGVECRDNGAIKVDENFCTTVPNIFALGDCTDILQLTPVAIAEAMAFTDTQFNNRPTPMDYDDIATAVFSQPPVGTVGLTEEEARARYSEVDIYKSEYRPLKYTLGGSEERTMMKLIVDRASDRVVGAHMVGMDAGEIIQGVGIAVKCGATKAQFDATMAIHPTSAEEFVVMRAPVSE